MKLYGQLIVHKFRLLRTFIIIYLLMTCIYILA